MHHRSAEIHELASALCLAQSDMPVVKRNKANPFFKSSYADLTAIVECSRPSLTKNGLAVMQSVSYEEDAAFLCTTLIHKSGQSVESRVKITTAKNDHQSFSSAISYLKRISYAALVGVVTEDEDDDGEYAMKDARHQKNYTPAVEKIDKKQLAQLETALDGYPALAEKIKTGLKINNIADMPDEKFESTMQWIRKTKRVEFGVEE